MPCEICGREGCSPSAYVSEVIVYVRHVIGEDDPRCEERRVAMPPIPYRCAGSYSTVTVHYLEAAAGELARQRAEYAKLKAMFEP